MVRVTEELALSPQHVTLHHATDPLLGHLPVLIFFGPSTTANYTLNSSRVQVHVYSPAGFQSYPRLTISPNSPFYGVVNHLPREFQGDETYRGLAFGLFKYFAELPEMVKNQLRNSYPTTRARRPGSAPALFGEQHAADLAQNMTKSEVTADVVNHLQNALQTQHISNVDLDLVLPPGAILPLQPEDLEEIPDDEDDILDPTLRQYGGYTPLVRLFGEPIFLPTAKLRRAPSKPTSLNRSKSFTKDQKVELRMKLGELVETEERYVAKLNELVKHIADNFRQSAKQRETGSLSPSEEELERLFPSSADTILQLNSVFMAEMRKIMDESEEEALKDMETPTVALTGSKLGAAARVKDPTGALSLARLFLEWFPKFTEGYQDYIRASQHFPSLLNGFLAQQSSFRQRVNQTGEQMVRSILIEPVQRLPRYSLLIDQIVSCLPMTHPALQPMLKARDIITNICSMDEPLPEKPHITTRLRNMVECWPMDLEPQGRLIVSADFVELLPPFDQPDVDDEDNAGLFLLFSDCVVILKKKVTGLRGRDILRELDRPSAEGLMMSMTNAAGGPASYELAFAGWHSLADVRFTESSDGQMIWMSSTQELKGGHAGPYVKSTAVTSRCFLLTESYEGKASKWSEDVVKTRVEGRFSDTEREDPCWTLRSVRMPDNNLGMFAAVFQEGVDQLIEGRKEPAAIRVVVDHEKGTKGAPVGHYGVEIVVNVKMGDGQRVSMNTVGLSGKVLTDEIALEDFLPTLSRRIIQLLSSQFNVSNLRLSPALVSYHTKTLKSMTLTAVGREKTRSFLATSPVKLLSSFWGGGSAAAAAEPPSPTKHARTPVAGVFPAPSLPRTNSQHSIFGSIRDKDRVPLDDGRPENPLMRLEQTFTGYVAALQSRKGSIIGRTFLSRSGVDELAVNDLYNRLIESPFDIDAAMDLTADVIFVAFEKFLRIAWSERMGPIMTIQALDTLQARANKRVPGDFADFVNYLFSDMAPQNRRAFTALIKLLADLLDGCGNDSDRGALTLAFAEMLAPDGTAHNYINLLDRLVEDCDRIFEEIGFSSSVHLGHSAYESLNSTTRSAKSHTGSLTSSTSSLRRKFGLEGLLRQNSKDSGHGSVWRSLSKHNRNALSVDTSQSSSLSKGSLGRSRSIEMGLGGPSPNRLRRPGSRDRPPVAGAFEEIQRPSSSHRLESTLETIGEPEVEATPAKTPRRKRRSSLSDLRSLMAATSLADSTTLMPLDLNQQTSEKFNSTPRIPPPSRIPISPPPSRIPISPGSQGARTPRQKENHSDSLNGATASEEKPKGHTKTLSTTNIPMLRKPTTSGESGPRPTTSPSKAGTSQKLRLQSPQKLRERLQTEKQAVDEVDASLKSELSRITEDMARVNGQGGRAPAADLRKLSASVQALEERVPAAVKEITDRHLSVQRDMETNLKASEAKVKAVDQLYKEAMAENELLYEKFNGELGKIVKAIKGKGRDDREELVAKVREQSEETARVKKENARLRREMASLRAAVRALSGEGSK
ncbi:related to Rho guanyl nucleotide exchange factor [Cephalotrichum gorgonifer]|uniref:Related to Rho guanyl nucleotide exchange factor n=1 Tax=Cephalotrichum gorgonifer TaxID=2041049 RepID=A0AAE8MU29_9PEZI|nr:related to Rho guanyl nucleotide exchange factor [Cephalotrichum gorgonifer]